MSETVFYDLGKLETALAQRDALVKALEECADQLAGSEYKSDLRVAEKARAILAAVGSLPTRQQGGE